MVIRKGIVGLRWLRSCRICISVLLVYHRQVQTETVQRRDDSIASAVTLYGSLDINEHLIAFPMHGKLPKRPSPVTPYKIEYVSRCDDWYPWSPLFSYLTRSPANKLFALSKSCSTCSFNTDKSIRSKRSVARNDDNRFSSNTIVSNRSTRETAVSSTIDKPRLLFERKRGWG